MIDSGKLTSEEGERLLLALHPAASGSVGSLLTTLFQQSSEQPLRLRVAVGQGEGAPQTDFSVPMAQVEQVIASILQAIFQGQRGKITQISDAFGHIELFIEDDHSQL